MKTSRFLRDMLQDEARITIAHENGDIWYEGDVMSLPRVIVIGTEVVGVALSQNSCEISAELIITVK